MQIIKRHGTFVYFILCFLFVGCSGVYFQHPMPENKKNLSTFNKGMWGQYFLVDSIIKDSSGMTYNFQYFPELYKTMDSVAYFNIELALTENAIILYDQEIIYYNLTIFDEDKIAINGYEKDSDGYFMSLRSTINVDTIFSINDTSLLRKYKKNYFLNDKLSNDKWEIYKLTSLNKDRLMLSLTDEKDENTLANYIIPDFTEEGILRATPIVSMDNNAFKKFIRSGGFGKNFIFKALDFNDKYK